MGPQEVPVPKRTSSSFPEARFSSSSPAFGGGRARVATLSPILIIVIGGVKDIGFERANAVGRSRRSSRGGTFIGKTPRRCSWSANSGTQREAGEIDARASSVMTLPLPRLWGDTFAGCDVGTSTARHEGRQDRCFTIREHDAVCDARIAVCRDHDWRARLSHLAIAATRDDGRISVIRNSLMDSRVNNRETHDRMDHCRIFKWNAGRMMAADLAVPVPVCCRLPAEQTSSARTQRHLRWSHPVHRATTPNLSAPSP